MAAMKTSGVFSIFLNASCAISAVMNRERGVPEAKTPTSAPAEKNFSDALVTPTADLMVRSRRASLPPATGALKNTESNELDAGPGRRNLTPPTCLLRPAHPEPHP